jgi:hypothetical protein
MRSAVELNSLRPGQEKRVQWPELEGKSEIPAAADLQGDRATDESVSGPSIMKVLLTVSLNAK